MRKIKLLLVVCEKPKVEYKNLQKLRLKPRPIKPSMCTRGDVSSVKNREEITRASTIYATFCNLKVRLMYVCMYVWFAKKKITFKTSITCESRRSKLRL
jgi:hypothetical protein